MIDVINRWENGSLPDDRMGFNRLTMAMGMQSARLRIQTARIILYACRRVCQMRDFRGRQMAKYRSNDIATRVQTPTDTDTAVSINNIFENTIQHWIHSS